MTADTNYPLSADDGPDDLPRALRREKEAREAEAAAGESTMSDFAVQPATAQAYSGYDADLAPASVRRFDVPFGHLMFFFLKAVVAAIPALILLVAILWGLGEVLQIFGLSKMHIQINIPPAG